MKTREPIVYRKAFVKVPYKCIISVSKIKEHKFLKEILEENPELFDEDEQSDADQLTLFLFLLYERQRGNVSFWKPYLDAMPDVEFFCHWDSEIIKETQDVAVLLHSN